eukprot:symbB.v1.2.015679.t1/scaffold1179.1/size133475/2
MVTHLQDPSATTKIEVFGTNAIKTVVRSILSAEADLNEEISGRHPCRLAVTVRRIRDDTSEDEHSWPGFALRIRCTTDLPPPTHGEIRVAHDTNVGKLAGTIARRLREKNVALVRGAGAVSLKRQLRGIAIASGYLEERDELVNQELATLLRLEDGEENGYKITQNLLTVYKSELSLEFQASSAAHTLSHRLSIQSRKSKRSSEKTSGEGVSSNSQLRDVDEKDDTCTKAQLNRASASTATSGFIFPVKQRPRSSNARTSDTGVMAMLDELFPTNCVLRRKGCWPKKKAKKPMK